MSRAGKYLAAVLLAVVPTSYLVVAAAQSRDSGVKKERSAAAASPLPYKPGRTLRNIYKLPVPDTATQGRFFETNSWETSSLYVRFVTTPGGLDGFLKQVGTSRGELLDSHISFTRDQEKTVGWNFHGAWAARQRLAGISLPSQTSGKPSYNLVVNLTDEFHPAVYAVSTVTF
jgi:hypothetical protein